VVKFNFEEETKMSKFLFRCDRSGVFYGELGERNGQECTIKNVRKIFSWTGAACLEQLASEGTKRPKDCKFTMTIESTTVFDLIQILPCTDIAVQSIEGVIEWKI
jgi:hypothetical protein